MAGTQDDCCGETQPTNPKVELMRARRKGKKGLQFLTIKNPIPEEIADSRELKKLFSKWQLVPYAGTTKETGHTLLAWYAMLYDLSATHNACIDKKLKYAVGGRATAIFNTDPEWDTGEENKEVGPALKKAYKEAINEFFEFQNGIGQFHYDLGAYYEATGNSFVEMSVAETLGQVRFHLKVHKIQDCLYVNTEPGEMRMVAVSPVWEEAYLKKHEPRIVPIYPNFARGEDGVLRTMFHLKCGNNTWYGRPSSKGSALYQYREVQDALYLIKQAGANFTGQLIIEVEDDDPELSPAIDEKGAKEQGYSSFAERFEMNYTQKSDDPQSVLVTARPYGSRPMFVFQVNPNTNENWYKITGDLAELKIVRSHGCTLRFMAFDVSNGFSTEVFVSDYVINMEPVIESLRQELTGFTNKIISAGWEILGLSKKWDGFALSFMAPIQSAIDDYKTAQKAPQQSQQQPSAAPDKPGQKVGGQNEPGNTV